eukprot:TRINITY_DN34952_c0_g1_i1.p1 TRINITY_DN34952_c0_g1~~TRINITY_DN34952_c0_g1_i1.p1  ORF type:complete len:250 (+),score=14.46 TRINITY_DN34952_c0_g1_i1:95-844(+)
MDNHESVPNTCYHPRMDRFAGGDIPRLWSHWQEMAHDVLGVEETFLRDVPEFAQERWHAAACFEQGLQPTYLGFAAVVDGAGSYSTRCMAGRPSPFSTSSPATSPLDTSTDGRSEGQTQRWRTTLEARDDLQPAYFEQPLPSNVPLPRNFTRDYDELANMDGESAALGEAEERQRTAPQSVVSVGSAGHATGDCRPCAHHWRAQGCVRGELCERCHLCPETAFREYRQALKVGKRARTRKPTVLPRRLQ